VARNAVGDTGGGQRLIKTLPRKGFRFVGAVREDQGPAERRTPASLLSRRGRLSPCPTDPQSQCWHSRLCLRTRITALSPKELLEDVVTGLAKLCWLVVVSRNSSFGYKSKTADVGEIGRVLGIRYVLEGTARRLEGRTRATGQLIDTTTGAYICAERYDLRLSDILTHHDEIPKALAASVGSIPRN
jgi:adenylate cyclase